MSNSTSSVQMMNTWINSNNSQYQSEAEEDGHKIHRDLNETEKRKIDANNSAVFAEASKLSGETFITTDDLTKTTRGPFVEPETEIHENETLGKKHKDNEDTVNMNDASKTETNSKTSAMSGIIGVHNKHNSSKFTKWSFMKGTDIAKDEDNSDIAKAPSVDKHCITCDIHILRFSLAVIVIDWLFVICGTAYFCNFVYHRFSSITSQILLING
jgi:hypothetical protein